MPEECMLTYVLVMFIILFIPQPAVLDLDVGTCQSRYSGESVLAVFTHDPVLRKHVGEGL